MKILLLILCCLYLPVFVGAQAVFKANLSQTETILDKPVELRFVLENAKFVNFPALNLTDFDVMGPSTMQSQTYINGKSSGSEIYTFMLYPRREGKFTIPKITIKTNTNQTFSSPALTLAVLKTKVIKQNQKNTIFVKTAISNLKPVLGEQLLIDFKLYKHANSPEIQGANIAKLPQSDGLLMQEMRGFENDWKLENLNGQQFMTIIIHRAVAFASQTGKIIVDGGMIQVGVLEEYNPNGFGSLAQVVPVTLKSEPLEIEVGELGDFPPFYNGAVGEYEMQAYVEKNNITTDDAVRLFVRINGEGDVKQVFAPELICQDSAFEYFKPKFTEEIVVTSKAIGGVKTFEFLLTPTKIGSFTISPVFVFFDNNLKRFVKKDTTFTLNVSQGKNVLIAKIDKKIDKINTDTLKMLHLQIEANLSIPYKFQFFASFYFYISLIISWLLFPIGILYKRKKAADKSNTAQISISQNASKMAKSQLAESAKWVQANQDKEFYQAIEMGLQQYISDKTNLPLSDISKQTIQNILLQKAVNQQFITQFLQILDTCHLALYAGIFPSLPKIQLQQQAENLIDNLEKCL
jgi:BatD DUF11 like domain